MTKRLWAKYVENNTSVDNVSSLGCFVSGGVGGFTCWVVQYPQDVIKTRLQVAKKVEFPNYSKLMPDGGFINCGKYIYKSEGLWGFWRGFSACATRAIIANSFMFAAYEYAKKKINQS